MTDSKKLVIIGGGAAGLLLAKLLSSDSGRLGLEITLVDCKDFFEFTPAMCSVLYENTDEEFKKHFQNVTADYASVLAPLQVKFILGIVEELNTEDQVINLRGNRSVSYDYCVICTGSSCHTPWKSSCETTTSLQDRLEYLQSQRERYKTAKEILCIGAGALGVEVAAEICLRDPSKSVTLISSQPVLASAPGNLGAGAQTVLSNIPSLKLIINESATSTDGRHYETDKSKTTIRPDLVYICSGITPNTGFLRKSHPQWLNEKNFIKVDQCLKASDNVFAVGDVNAIDDPKMFYTARTQAVHTATNIKRILKGHEPIPYKAPPRAMMVSLGPTRAVGYMMGITLNGWPGDRKRGSKLASFAKRVVERTTMDAYG
ncbi:uncharacterized protein VTP21DRAFT_6229 [Calcarisporiella thermophila]|uniref:uncharacterized protein n=1 Tax=Calcarisporiella thermophila TaxID=911321 RepID=UPI003742A70C